MSATRQDVVVGATSPSLTETDLSSGIAGRVPPVRLRARFRLGLVVVALMSLLLLLLYLALIGLASYGVYLHLVLDTWILDDFSIWRVVAYFSPAIAGAVMVFFLWKPILARPSRKESDVRIERAEAPLLFHFVDLIRGAVHAPPPSEIRLDTLVNASVGFRRGFLSFARRSDLTLTIGMPLLAGLTMRELGAVLGHELGHFAQGSGMRLTYVIRSINAWLARVAYERDSWDEGLAHGAAHWHWTISIPLALGQLAVWASRRVLAALALAGHGVGTYMMREMELDADRYEAGVAGSEAFEPTTRRVRLLAAAREWALALTAAEWREGRLPDDFAGLVVGLAGRIPAEARAEIEAAQKGSVFDTHPPDDRRIASAKAERAPGILRLDQPARLLVAEGSPLFARVSTSFYKSAFAAGRGRLHPVAELLARHDGKVSDQGAVERYFGSLYDFTAPFGVPPRGAPLATLAEGLETLQEARETALRLRADTSQAAAARAATRERMGAALALLAIPEVRARVGDAAALGVLGQESRAVGGLILALREIGELFGRLEREPENEDARYLLMEKLGALHVASRKLEQRLSQAPYPFAHVKGRLSVGAFVVHGLPDVDGIGPAVHGRVQAVLTRLAGLHDQALGRLAAIAERLEAAAEPRAS